VNVPGTLSASYIAVRWPRLYHMAEAGSWSSIRRHGLLSATAFLDLFEVTGPDRDRIEAARRGHPVVIEQVQGELIPVREPARRSARRRDATVNVSAFGVSVTDRGGGISGASKAGPELLVLVWAEDWSSVVRVGVAAHMTSQRDGRLR